MLRSILLIDDDELNNQLNKIILESMNVAEEIIVVEDGVEAIELLSAIKNPEQLPNLIFLDINMPMVNGFEFLEVFEKLEVANRNQLKVVILTTSSTQRDAEKALNYKIDDYLIKPLGEETLKKLLNKHFQYSSPPKGSVKVNKVEKGLQ